MPEACVFTHVSPTAPDIRLPYSEDAVGGAPGMPPPARRRHSTRQPIADRPLGEATSAVFWRRCDAIALSAFRVSTLPPSRRSDTAAGGLKWCRAAVARRDLTKPPLLSDGLTVPSPVMARANGLTVIAQCAESYAFDSQAHSPRHLCCAVIFSCYFGYAPLLGGKPCGGLKVLQHFSTHFCLSQKRHLCIAASLYSFCQRCHFCRKHIIFSAFNSSSFSLDICSVSLHIYVNLIYLHFIVIYGLLCDFINMFCTEVTSRCISVLRSLSALSALSTRTWRVRSSVSRPAPHAGRLLPLHTIHYPSS